MTTRRLARTVAPLALAAALGGTHTAAASSPPADSDIDGHYLVLRRLVEDRDWWGIDEVDTVENARHEARSYEIRTADGEVTIVPNVWGADLPEPGESWPATFVDGVLRAEVVEDTLPCLSSATGQQDGPTTDQVVSVVEAEQINESTFVGTFTRELRFGGAEECEPIEMGYDAEVYLVHLDKFIPATAVPGNYRVQYYADDVLWWEEHGVRECDTSEDCDIAMRLRWERVLPDDSTEPYYVEVPLHDEGGLYSGTATYATNCTSGADRSFIAEDVYAVELEILALFVDLGDEAAIVTIQGQDGQLIDPDAPTADLCAPFGELITTAGLAWDGELDWDAPAAPPLADGSAP